MASRPEQVKVISDAASFEVIGQASSLHDDVHDYLDCRSVVKRQFPSGFRHVWQTPVESNHVRTALEAGMQPLHLGPN